MATIGNLVAVVTTNTRGLTRGLALSAGLPAKQRGRQPEPRRLLQPDTAYVERGSTPFAGIPVRTAQTSHFSPRML